MGRPRGVDDLTILRAAADVIGQVGPAGLTLAAVAREVGVVPGTLVQRFGSKRGLMLALAQESAKHAESMYEGARDEHATALMAVTDLAVTTMAVMTTPEVYANHLAFLCLDLADPELHEHALTIHRAQRRVYESLLAEAVDNGELSAGTNVAALAATIQTVVAGAGLTWALDREGTLPHRLEREIITALAPHVPPHGGSDTEGS
ncbi:TetR/AcrR family transcriptional regulator [Streptomyces sp. NPDC031705]|uniref:TetR/AcrR family transcriptional regulator n=1 Tax=unclassified Streptomyces TaxID=2593676 RepID=UPI0033C8063A